MCYFSCICNLGLEATRDKKFSKYVVIIRVTFEQANGLQPVLHYGSRNLSEYNLKKWYVFETTGIGLHLFYFESITNKNVIY